MKRQITLLLLVLPFLVFAQQKQNPQLQGNELAAKAKVEQLQAAHIFKQTTKSAAAKYSEAVNDGVVVEFDAQMVQSILKNKSSLLNLEIPLKTDGQTVKLELTEINIYAPGFRAMTSTGLDITDKMDKGRHYWGHVAGASKSLVAFSVFKNEIMGFVALNEGNYTIGKLRDSETEHIIYKDSDLKLLEEFACGTEDDEYGYKPGELTYSGEKDAGDCVNVYVEAGQSVYNSFGGDLPSTINFLNGVFAQSYVLYANEGITMQTSDMLIWTTPDPYTGPSSLSYRNQFQANTPQNGFNGDIGHLVEVHNVGGIAAGFSGICNPDTDQSLCFSGFDGTSFANVPTVSFNVFIISHEMGHLLGSRHTHACVWNGNNTAIDGCSGVEGVCAQPPIPPANTGTVMSYCINNAGLNFVEGFHPQPQAVMLNNINAPGNCLVACGGPGNIINNAMACDLNIAIPDNACINANIAVSGEAGNALGTNIILTQVDLIINHTWNQDLDIHLISPNGVSVEISTDNGGTGDHYGNPSDCPNTVASFRMDAASLPPTTDVNISGTFLPEGDFVDFNDGSNPNGIWMLELCDDDLGVVGELEYVKLTFGPPPCPTSVTVNANPSGDICLGTTGVQYTATVVGGMTPSYAWCAYNSGNGSGTCFNGFIPNNTDPAPTRNWTSSTGAKSVQVTVTQTGCTPVVSPVYSFNVIPTPSNDNACGAMPMSVGVPQNANSQCASAQPGEANPGAGTGGGGSCNSQDGWCNIPSSNEPGVQNSLWYTFVAPASGHVEIATDNTDDTQLALWSVGNCSNFATYTEIAANDDSGPGFSAAVICAQVVPGQTYYIQIDGFDGFEYNTNIIITELDPIVNDDVCNAIPMTIGQPYNANSFNPCGNADAQPGEATPGVGTGGDGCEAQDGWCNYPGDNEPGIQNSLWYTFVAPTSGQVDISTDDEDDAQLAIWSAGDCNDFGTFVLIAANDDSGPGFAPFIDNACLEPGQTYYVQIDGFNGTLYNTNITVTEVGVALEITCPVSVTVECNESPDPPATGEATANTNDCCTNAPAITHNDVPSGLGCSYSILRTWTATYDCGKVLNCDQTITVNDPAPVIVTCPDDQTIEWVAGFNMAPVGPNTPQDPSIDPSNYNNIVYTETCLNSIVYQDMLIGPSPNNCPSLWIVERTWTLTDDCGQTDVCVQTFTFTDTTDPWFTFCPPSPATAIEWPAGFNTAPVGANTPQDPSIAPANYGMATAADNCGNPAVTYQDVIAGPDPSNNCAALWTVTRTWTAIDNCIQTATCVQVFTFTDTTNPVIGTCPPTRNVEGCGTADIMNGGLTALPFSAVPLLITEAGFMAEGGSASDNCAIVSYSYVDVANGICPTVVTRVFTVTDACGLTAVCTQIINIDDTTPPVVACQDITVSLTANGDLNIAPSQVYDAVNSSDNCGAVGPVSVSPSYFTCLNEGANTVTLTGEDACGNPATCTATVTIAPFITNISVVPTDESCAGAGDGTVAMSATAGGGQVGYSVDGGVNFQFNGNFNNLTPGTYNWVIKVFGVPATCEKTGTVTVGAGGPAQTWWKDADNDGYHDGTSILSCTPVAGHSTTAVAGDCNDNNWDVNPGAAEICDGLDNNCDGVVPANETDADGDGYRVCDGDCNDNNAAVNPGAAEICDGLDNNCAGGIDEGLSGETYVGNVSFTSQAQLNAWPACYSTIQGNVTIQGATITNLGPLSNIATVTGNLMILMNTALTSLNGLDNLASVGGAFYMYYNFQLSNCCAIDNLLTNGGIGGAILIFYNKTGSHCNSAAAIMAACPIAPLVANPNGNTASAEPATVEIGKKMAIYPNPASQEVTVLFDRAAPTATLRIMDMLGRVVYEMEMEEGVDRVGINLESSAFENGLYLVSFYEDGEMTTKQLVVQR